MRRNDKGETLKLEFLSADPAVRPGGEPFIENLRKVGVDATGCRGSTIPSIRGPDAVITTST
jgi:hypothetical protein